RVNRKRCSAGLTPAVMRDERGARKRGRYRQRYSRRSNGLEPRGRRFKSGSRQLLAKSSKFQRRADQIDLRLERHEIQAIVPDQATTGPVTGNSRNVAMAL